MLHHCAQGLSQAVCTLRLLRSSSHQFYYVFALQSGGILIAMFATVLVRAFTKTLNDFAADILAIRLHGTEIY